MAPHRRILLILTAALAVAVGAAVVPFNSSYAAVVAPAPRLVSPANETDTPIKDLVLKWEPVAGASAYQVAISRNKDWTNNEVDLPGGGITKATLFEVPLGLPHATYFWRVRAKLGGSNGAWSQSWQFFREWEAPINILKTPTSADPTLSWAPVPGASKYHVIFSTSQIKNKDLLDGTTGCFTANTSLTPGTGGNASTGDNSFQCDVPGLVDNTTYFWGIAAFDDTTAAALVLSGNATGCGTKLPECDATVGPGGSFTYHAPASGGTASSISGLKTTWHGQTSTTNDCDVTVACPMTPTFSWTPVPGADLYVIDVYLDRDATTLYREYVSQTGTITPPDQFQDAQPGKPYYWRVDASTCGGAGVQCSAPAPAAQGCPTPGSTTGGATPTPAPSSTPAPAPSVTGVKVVPAGPTGDQSMQGGTTRTITITGANINPGACVIASTGVVTSVPVVATNSMSFNYYAPVPGGSATFQVENADGQVSNTSTAITVASSAHSLALSAISQFQKRSGPITLRSPADHAVLGASTFTFDWEDYIASGSQGTYDPKNYELEVSTTKNFDTPVLSVDGIDLTQYTDPNGTLKDGHYYWRVNGIDQSGNELTWSAKRQFTVNADGPTVRITTANGHGLMHPLTIEFSDIVKGVNSNTLKVVPEGYPVAAAVPGRISLGASPTQYVFKPKHPFATGGTYDLAVKGALADANGNPVEVAGESVRMRTVAKNRSNGWHYSRGWKRHAASGTVSGSYVSAGPDRTARIRLAGNQVELAGCKGPGMGSISVTVGGKTQRISEKQSFTRCGVVLWHRTLPAGESTLKIRVTGGHGNFDAVRTT